MRYNYKLVLIIYLLTSSCTTFREVHYFKDKIEDEKLNNPTSIVPNYYKVEIRGWSFMSSSRYLSGYFDQNAVNEYFNEISQPENGTLFVKENKIGNNNSSKISSLEDKNKSVGLKENGSELVLILSTNSEAVASQIKNTAVNKDVIKSLTLLANKEKIKESNETAKKVKSIESEISLFILKVDNYINSLNNNANDKKKIFQFLRSELKDLGVEKKFQNLEQIKLWYENN